MNIIKPMKYHIINLIILIMEIIIIIVITYLKKSDVPSGVPTES